MARRGLAALLALCLLAQALGYPQRRLRRATGDDDQSTDSAALTNAAGQSFPSKSVSDNEIVPPVAPVSNDDDDDDDDGFESMETSSTGDGSNIFSLLRIAGAILPSFSNANEENSNESNSGSKSESNESGDTASEESMENLNGNDSKESDTNDASVEGNDSDYDSDEPPGGGDGQGGGILGLLAGLSGGEDGQSDLGSLLATVSGIVANLSGDGIDLNALIASGIGLFVGLLSEGEENPGAVLASYLLTSLDTLTGGGSKNNGAFFGTFLSKLIKGTSAAGGSDESSEENGNKMKMTDSAGFVASFLMGILGDMSKGSSGGSHPW